jgi:hypothetical protein
MSAAYLMTRRSVPRGLERDVAARVGQHAHRRVGVGRVPARVLRVVVELVVGIPAEHDVAEAEAARQRGQELLARHVLAAHDPVDVEDADLDVVDLARGDEGSRIFGGLDASRIHGLPRFGRRRRMPYRGAVR